MKSKRPTRQSPDEFQTRFCHKSTLTKTQNRVLALLNGTTGLTASELAAKLWYKPDASRRAGSASVVLWKLHDLDLVSWVDMDDPCFLLTDKGHKVLLGYIEK